MSSSLSSSPLLNPADDSPADATSERAQVTSKSQKKKKTKASRSKPKRKKQHQQATEEMLNSPTLQRIIEASKDLTANLARIERYIQEDTMNEVGNISCLFPRLLNLALGGNSDTSAKAVSVLSQLSAHEANKIKILLSGKSVA